MKSPLNKYHSGFHCFVYYISINIIINKYRAADIEIIDDKIVTTLAKKASENVRIGPQMHYVT